MICFGLWFTLILDLLSNCVLHIYLVGPISRGLVTPGLYMSLIRSTLVCIRSLCTNCRSLLCGQMYDQKVIEMTSTTRL